MNAFERILSALGISNERFEKMSEAEQANLKKISSNQETLEQERDTAISERDTAQGRVTELEGELTTANDSLQSVNGQLEEANANLETANARISELEGQVSDLNAKLAKKPAATVTAVVADEEEGEHAPGKKAEEPKKYWTSADQELAEFHAKFNRKK